MRTFDVFKDTESIEWTNTWIENSKDFSCNRILLIGGSNARAYRKYLQKLFDTPVNFVGTSSLWVDPRFIHIFDAFFKYNYKYSLIFLELGTHNGSYNTKDVEKDRKAYAKSFENFIKYLRKKTKNIVVISSKPVKFTENPEQYNNERNQEIISRNAIQKEIAEKYNLKYIDIYDFLMLKDYVYKDHIHFKEDFANLSVAKHIYNEFVDAKRIDSKQYVFSDTLPFESDGLYDPEAWGCWSNGNSTSLYFATDTICTATFDVKPFLVKGKEKQTVDVYINDHKKGEYSFEFGKKLPQIVIDLPKSKKIHIMFKYNDVKSPKELGISDDTRKIAIGFKSMEIK